MDALLEYRKERDEVHEVSKAAWIPTPEDIKAACLEIQAGWSRGERRRRERAAFGLPIQFTIATAKYTPGRKAR